MMVILIGAVFGIIMVATILVRPVYGVYGGFALLGVLVAPDLPMVGERLAAPDGVFVLAMLGAAIHWSSGNGRPVRLGEQGVKTTVVLVGLFLVASSASLLYGEYRFGENTVGSIIRTLNYVYGGLLMVFIAWIVNSWDKWRFCLAAWLVGASLVTMVAVVALLGVGPQWAGGELGSGRISATTRNPNQLASYLGATVPIAFGFMLAGWRQGNSRNILGVIVLGILLAGMLMALMGTGSRSAIVMGILALVSAIGYVIARRRLGNVVNVANVVIGVGLLGTVMGTLMIIADDGMGVLPEGMRATERPVSRLQEADDVVGFVGSRAEQIRMVQENWWRYPILGIGPDNFKTVYDNRHEVHNTYLGILIENGLLGVSLLVGSLAALVWTGIRSVARVPKSHRAHVVMLLLSLTVIFAHWITGFGLRQRPFWLVAGLVLSAAMIARREKSRTASEGTAPGLLGHGGYPGGPVSHSSAASGHDEALWRR